MKVYAVLWTMAYEGQELLHVFASKEDAYKKAFDLNVSDGLPDGHMKDDYGHYVKEMELE